MAANENTPNSDSEQREPADHDSAISDPAETDHPTGEKQAAENEENEPAG